MKFKRGLALWVCVLAWLVAGPAIWAQDEAQADEAAAEPEVTSNWIGKIFAEASGWVAQPVGTQFTPATVADPTNPFNTTFNDVPHGTELRYRWRAGFKLKNEIGDVILTWYSHEQDDSLLRSSPGAFIYGQALSNPLHAGVNDDGLADGFTTDVGSKLRDLRVDFYRKAFDTERIQGRWFIGLRRTFVKVAQEASYFALNPGLPPLLPPVVNSPRDDLDPSPDTARMESNYDGRGAEAGLEVRMPLFRDRITLEASLVAAVLRGDVDTRYSSNTHFYAVIDSNNEIVQFLAPPYDEFTDLVDPNQPSLGYLVDSIRQFNVPIGVRGSQSGTAMVLETHLGFRWRAWRDLEVLGGFRNMRIDDAVYESRAKNVTVSQNGAVNTADLSQTQRGIGYEGFYLGIAYTYGR